MAKRRFEDDVDVNTIVLNRYSRSTQYSDNTNERSLREFIRVKKSKELEEVTKQELENILVDYFVKLRKS